MGQAAIRMRAVAVLTAMLPLIASAQVDTLARQSPPAIDALRVEIARDASRSVLELPFAISRLSPDSLRPALRKVSLGDLLFGMAGVQVQSRNNPTQDARIAVRGFGARSAFGVRGVKVLRDGVPLSLPDGQTPTDWLDPETVGSVEAIRGTAAALYGNAAGGVIDFRTRPSSSRPFSLDTKWWNGGGAARMQLLGSGTVQRGADNTSPTTWLASVTRTETDGPRMYARQEATSAVARFETVIDRTRLRLLANGYDMPLAQNPGALTAAELSRNVRLADSTSVARGAGKTVRHGQLALVAEQGDEARNLSAAAWYGARDLDNPLPFAVITVDRRNAGLWVRGSATISLLGRTGRASAGLDIQSVTDDRRNLDNCVGQALSTRCPVVGLDRGALRLDQREQVQSEGGFVRYELPMGDAVDASVALRVDQIRFRLGDNLVSATDRDDSGEQAQSAVNPMLALTWRLRPALSLYTSLSTAFETPTVTELTTQADGSAGLNGSLAPQRTRTAEVGVRGLVGAFTWLDIALFAARTTDELVPFDVPNAPGRRAFRNAGRTAREGLEASVRMQRSIADVGLAYTGSRFRFVDYIANGNRFDGNVIPGSPSHQLQGWFTARTRGWFGTVDVSAASSAFTDDANANQSGGWAAVGVRAGGEGAITVSGWQLSPVVGVENVFDRRYASAILVNATRGRFYEPASPRLVYAGLRLQLP